MKRVRKKKKATKTTPDLQAHLGKTQEILPPEGVPLRFKIAYLGSRLGAQLIDIIITVVGLIALMILLVTSDWILSLIHI